MAVTKKVTVLWHVTPCSQVHHLGNKILLDFYFALLVSCFFFFFYFI